MNAIFRRIKLALDFQKINDEAKQKNNRGRHGQHFLRAMISHPSESSEEKEVVALHQEQRWSEKLEL